MRKCWLLTASSPLKVRKITAGLKKIKKQIDEGQFDFSIELEDIHMNIEKRLTDDIGDAGARLHTARSETTSAPWISICT